MGWPRWWSPNVYCTGGEGTEVVVGKREREEEAESN